MHKIMHMCASELKVHFITIFNFSFSLNLKLKTHLNNTALA